MKNKTYLLNNAKLLLFACFYLNQNGLIFKKICFTFNPEVSSTRVTKYIQLKDVIKFCSGRKSDFFPDQQEMSLFQQTPRLFLVYHLVFFFLLAGHLWLQNAIVHIIFLL